MNTEGKRERKKMTPNLKTQHQLIQKHLAKARKAIKNKIEKN